ncbi:MAG: hypothetical protein ACW981_20355 [Candidatus Hodarchaeales archaeon]
METTGKRSVAGIVYADGQKRYIPLMYALPIAFVVSLLTLIIFSLIGAGSNAILAQIEVILLAILFCLPGILTRSKLRGILFSVPVTLIVIVVYELVIVALLGSGTYNPYAVAGVLKEPLINVINSNAGVLGFSATDVVFGTYTAENLLSLLIVVDLIIVAFVIFFGSWAASWIATLFWDKEGNLSIIAVIFKPIAVILAIIFLFFFPIAIHAASSTTGGAGFIVAGFGEILAGFSPPGTTVVVAGQGFNLDLETLDVENLREHTNVAKGYFDTADARFSLLQGNLLFSFVLDQLPPEFRNVDNTLDLVGTMADVTYVLPELFYIFLNAKEGLTVTGEALSGASGSTTYDPGFREGLSYINLMGGNFSAAWDCKDESHPEGQENCGLKSGIQKASSITDIGALKDFVNLDDFITALDIGVDAFDEAWPAFLPFLNGTYKIILGTSALGTNDFDLASSWIESAASEFEESDKILSNVTDVQPVNITVQGSEPIPIPIDGVINLAKDLNRLLIPFSYSAAAGINFFGAMADLMTAMQNLNLTDKTSIGNDATWAPVESNLALASSYFAEASFNIGLAKGNLTDMVESPRYGDLLNPIFVGQPGDPTIFRQVEDVITQFDSNVTVLSDILLALTDTFRSFRNFGSATSQLDIALQLDATGNATRPIVINQYQNAIANATSAWNILDNMTASSQLNSASRVTWLNTLLSDYGEEDPNTDVGTFTFIGLTLDMDYGGIIAISDVMKRTLEAVETNPAIYDALITLAEALDLGTLFGP